MEEDEEELEEEIDEILSYINPPDPCSPLESEEECKKRRGRGSWSGVPLD